MVITLADIPPTVDTPKALKSFEQFRKLKGKQWKSKCSKKTEKYEEVTISVGLLEWKETDMKLKPVRGKRIALRVSNKAPYTVIFSKAIEKWKAYQSQLYKKNICLSMKMENKLNFCQELWNFSTF